MELKRVVVTGLGALTPIGNTKDEYWNGLVNGKSGAAPITHFDAAKFKTRFACEVKDFNINDFVHRKEARKMDKFTQFAMVVADEAITNSKLDLEKVDRNPHFGEDFQQTRIDGCTKRLQTIGQRAFAQQAALVPVAN